MPYASTRSMKRRDGRREEEGQGVIGIGKQEADGADAAAVAVAALCPCCLSLSKCPRGAPTNRGVDPALPSSNLIVHLSLRQPLSRIYQHRQQALIEPCHHHDPQIRPAGAVVGYLCTCPWWSSSSSASASCSPRTRRPSSRQGAQEEEQHRLSGDAGAGKCASTRGNEGRATRGAAPRPPGSADGRASPGAGRLRVRRRIDRRVDEFETRLTELNRVLRTRTHTPHT